MQQFNNFSPMNITIITLFPEMFKNVLQTSILKRAQEKKKVMFSIIALRDFGIGRHKTVDDAPYGGGVGMVLRVDVLHKAILSVKKEHKNSKVILVDPKGIPYSQSIAEGLSKEEDIILICGRYEGVDERIKKYIDMEISLGDFILTGGEIAAMAILDSVVRLLPGVLGKDDSSIGESFSKENGKRILEHPHYTRPEEYKGDKVPKVLISGNHDKIETFRKNKALEETRIKRPDLVS